MPRRWYRGPTVVAFVVGMILASGALTLPAFSATAVGNPTLTGAYQLYCPDPVETPIVLHVRASVPLAPARPVAGRRFALLGFQTEVTFPHGVASALAQMSPIRGKVTGRALLIGAAPHSHAFAESFVRVHSVLGPSFRV